MKRSQRSLSVELQVIEVLRNVLGLGTGDLDCVAYCNKSLNPGVYGSRDAFLKDYVYYSFLRKWKGFNDKRINPEWEAFSSWSKAEKLCFSTNRRLESEASTGLYSIAPSIISDAQRKVASVLGRLDFKVIAESCRFGPGATYDLKRGSSLTEKSIRPTITFDAIPLACHVLSHDDLLGSLVGPLSDLSIVSANRMVMVPKTVKTHRPIAAEPTLNGFIQQGFGRYIRKRLKHVGVDLDDQTVNQDLAKRALVEGLTTLDLSSASDTLCTNLVKLLLPREWFEALNSIRCKRTEYKGRRFLLSKFSSMGNAFTFELESLIFWSLVSSACTHGVTSVYGDDIIVKHEDYRLVLDVLTWSGFLVNEDKSFTDGSRFFESCGKHYFDSEEVTPCYQKDVCTRPADYVRLHNRLVRAGIRLNLRNEFESAASIVRERCRVEFGKVCPGIGPLVEYDEYFVSESFSWTSELCDRVKILSVFSRSIPVKDRASRDVIERAHLARKLRCPGFLNSSREGYVIDSQESRFIIKMKTHWRSSTS